MQEPPVTAADPAEPKGLSWGLETGFPVDPYPIDSTEVFGTPLCLTDWIMYYPCCLGKRFLTTPLQVLVFWSYRLFILPDHCLHAPGQQQPCGD